MKRLGLTLMAAVCLTATTFAAGNQPTTAKWDGNINVTKLSSKHLRLLLYTDGTCYNCQEGSEKETSQCSLWKLEVDEKSTD